eukprot:CAMPEP_0196657614 /NCGR_PEP_ID=MMETSP1086-20130531/24464_1 /TAXON_ID=77921 /ORGANISM="Cyanoptyche  gloeocystis , Strain SAG4.97" /LENGTH=242 /DNA_ID=CAMNT_0041990807 /DNA_START=344 /DNA_END=1072 /DNA_ORIENTATION=-
MEPNQKIVYSQNGEDGVLEYIFDNLGTTNRYYVEFGVEDGTQCNTRVLWERHGFDGLLMDYSGVSKDDREIRNHYLTAENIVQLFRKYSVPFELDLLSVDIDRNDYHLLKKILEADYRPRIIVAEINRNFGPKDSFVIKYDAHKSWDSSARFGMSPLAATKLAEAHGYQAIYYDKMGVNIFFLRRRAVVDYLRGKGVEDVDEEVVKEFLPPFEYVYRRFPAIHVESIKTFWREFNRDDWLEV